jgi:hypothetical protein
VPISGRAFFEKHYWTFRRVRDAYAASPQPRLNYWYDPEALNEVDRTILQALASASHVLDVGAGDLAVRRRLKAGGLQARYSTVDPTLEFAHDFSSLDEAPDDAFDAVLILEVIEHLTLEEFWGFMDQAMAKLRPKGTLVISTPNAEFVASVFAGDMTHVHAYRGPDLAAFLHCHGFESRLYRVVWRSPKESLRERLRIQLARVLTRGILQVDYARGILLIGRRTPNPRPPAV